MTRTVRNTAALAAIAAVLWLLPILALMRAL